MHIMNYAHGSGISRAGAAGNILHGMWGMFCGIARGAHIVAVRMRYRKGGWPKDCLLINP